MSIAGVVDLSITSTVLIATGLLLAMIVFTIVLRRRPKKLKPKHFSGQWQELQAMLADRGQWPEAIRKADSLLDEALRRRHFKGRSMGERLVAAQRMLTDNDGAWYGHKLKKQLEIHPDMKLRKQNVKDALIGLRQALKDLGALE